MAKGLRRFLLRLVLEEAIGREEKAYRFYESAQGAVRDPEAQELLRKLCAEELRHRLKLEELERGGELGREPQVKLSIPAEAELMSQGEPEWPASLERLSLREVWGIALEKERHAYEIYRLMSVRASLAVFRDVFAFLSAEELRHVEWVRGAAERA